MSNNSDAHNQFTRNPFSTGMTSELIADPALYKQMFSWEILAPEALDVFAQKNTVVTGPLGSGKSMLLNLVRHDVLIEFISSDRIAPPPPLSGMEPFLGLYINLTEGLFHAFGRRQILAPNYQDVDLNVHVAANYLVHLILADFLKALDDLVRNPKGQLLANWLGFGVLDADAAAQGISGWSCWRDDYRACSSLKGLRAAVNEKLRLWRAFLGGANLEIDQLTKGLSTFEEPIQKLGALVRDLDSSRRASLFIVFDQYEELVGLNKVYGHQLVRVINTLIKLRNPNVYVKIGARTHNWGRELKVWGSDDCIEEHRDYSRVDLSEILMRTGDGIRRRRFLFERLVKDAAARRIEKVGGSTTSNGVQRMFGAWSAEAEAEKYQLGQRIDDILERRLPKCIVEVLLRRIGKSKSTLELFLACSWIMQRLLAGESEEALINQIEGSSAALWTWKWWRKERVEVTLLQIASAANRRRIYYGWRTIVGLSGYNIMAFLLLFKEVWEAAVKEEIDPTKEVIPPGVQSAGIWEASRVWNLRTFGEVEGGPAILGFARRLGEGISAYRRRDAALSNPGYSGFSLRVTDVEKPELCSLRKFLQDCVGWGVLEERSHRSKQRNDGRRLKWYLHPLFSPYYYLPHTRVKEPFYINDPGLVVSWVSSLGSIKFGPRRKTRG